LINAGTYVLEPSVLRRIPTAQQVSIERVTFPEVAADGRLFAMPTGDYWLDAGNPALYLKANLDLLDGTRPLHTCDAIHEGARVDASAVVTNSIVADGVVVAANAKVSDSVLLPGAVVEARAVVANSVIMGKIGEGANVAGSVLGLHGRVAPGEQLSGESRPPADAT
jgi:mannose-1-phosphate guanylyltransferase